MRKTTLNSVNKVTKNKHHGSLRDKAARSLKQLFAIKIHIIHVIYAYRQNKVSIAPVEPQTTSLSTTHQ